MHIRNCSQMRVASEDTQNRTAPRDKVVGRLCIIAVVRWSALEPIWPYTTFGAKAAAFTFKEVRTLPDPWAKSATSRTHRSAGKLRYVPGILVIPHFLSWPIHWRGSTVSRWDRLLWVHRQVHLPLSWRTRLETSRRSPKRKQYCPASAGRKYQAVCRCVDGEWTSKPIQLGHRA